MAATDPVIAVVPATEASWDDLPTVFGAQRQASRCQFQRYKLQPRESFSSFPAEERAFRLRRHTDCDHLGRTRPSGLVAYEGGEPVGWWAVETRTSYPRLLRSYRALVRAAVDFAEVSHPTLRRVVMRVDV